MRAIEKGTVIAVKYVVDHPNIFVGDLGKVINVNKDGSLVVDFEDEKGVIVSTENSIFKDSTLVKKALSRQQLSQMSRLFRKFCRTLEDNCRKLAFYRGHIYDRGSSIQVDLVASKESGVFVTAEMLMSKSGHLLASKDFHFRNKERDAVTEAFITLIEGVGNLPIEINEIYFDFLGSDYERGFLEKDEKDTSCAIIYLISMLSDKDDSGFSVYGADKKVKEGMEDLYGNWAQYKEGINF